MVHDEHDEHVEQLARQADDRFRRAVEARRERKERARREDRSTLFWIGTWGLVGWSVAMPTLLGVALGVWLDRAAPARFSWTLTLLLAGLVVGCLVAWYWVQRELRRGGAGSGED